MSKSKLIPFSDTLYATLAVGADGSQVRVGRFYGVKDFDRFQKRYGRLTPKNRVAKFLDNMCWLAHGSVTRTMDIAAKAAVDFRFVKIDLIESK